MSDSGSPMQGARPGLRAALRGMAMFHAVILALFCLCTALILSFVDDFTSAPIDRRAAEDLAASLGQVIPASLHDNDPASDALTIDNPETGTVLVYRAVRNGTVTGLAFEMVAAGYAGPITVLLGVDPDGTLLGARVLAHAETPGLGDKIEARKSDWILGFSGRSLDDPQPGGWKVRRDGGVFDQFSGATITPRAVVDAVHRGLQFFHRHEAALLAPPAPPQEEP